MRPKIRCDSYCANFFRPFHQLNRLEVVEDDVRHTQPLVAYLVGRMCLAWSASVAWLTTARLSTCMLLCLVILIAWLGRDDVWLSA
jgi:hypothetical protein